MPGSESRSQREGRWVKPLAVVVGVLVVVLIFFAIGGLGLVSNLEHSVSAAKCAYSTTPAPPAHYDEQLYLVQGGNSGSITYYVPAAAQFDSNGYGPAYLVNGLTAVGYWYQVGIAYDWQCTGGHLNGFYFVTEVWDTSGQSVVGPSLVALDVQAGDEMNLSLTFAGSDVLMSVSDQTNGVSHSQSYPAEGATSFEGGMSVDPAEPGWFTGVMTEWYHVEPYYEGEAGVNYTAVSPLAGSASDQVTLVIDEQQVPGPVLFGQINAVVVGCPCYYPFSYENANETVGPSSFETGGS